MIFQLPKDDENTKEEDSGEEKAIPVLHSIVLALLVPWVTNTVLQNLSPCGQNYVVKAKTNYLFFVTGTFLPPSKGFGLPV